MLLMTNAIGSEVTETLRHFSHKCLVLYVHVRVVTFS